MTMPAEPDRDPCRRRGFVVAALSLLALSAPAAVSQDLPIGYETRTSLEDNRMDEFVGPIVEALASGDAADVADARDAVLERLTNPRVSVAFRLAVSDRIASELGRFATSEDAFVATNALLVAGEIATGDTSTVLMEAFGDERASVRFAAAAAASDTIVALGAPSPPMSAEQARRLTGELADLIRSDPSGEVAGAALRAIIAGREIDRGNLAVVAGDAIALGAEAAGERLAALSSPEDLDRDRRFLISVLSGLIRARETLTDDTRTVSQPVRCGVASVGAHTIGLASRVYRGIGRNMAGHRALFEQLIDASEKVVYFSEVGPSRPSNVIGALQGDGRDQGEAFIRGAISLVGPGSDLVTSGCDFPRAGFIGE